MKPSGPGAEFLSIEKIAFRISNSEGRANSGELSFAEMNGEIASGGESGPVKGVDWEP